MVSSEYIEDVRSYENLSKYKIMQKKQKRNKEKSSDVSGTSYDGSGSESSDSLEMDEMDSDFSKNLDGEEISSSEDFIEISDDDEGKDFSFCLSSYGSTLM